MTAIELKDLLLVGGVLLALGLVSVYWRMNMRRHCRREKAMTWLTAGDCLNLGSMLVVTIGGYLLPLVGLSTPYGAVFLGLAVLLFVGHLFALAAHYQLLDGEVVEVKRFPVQEQIVVAITLALAIIFLCLAYGTGVLPGLPLDDGDHPSKAQSRISSPIKKQPKSF